MTHVRCWTGGKAREVTGWGSSFKMGRAGRSDLQANGAMSACHGSFPLRKLAA